MFNIVLIEPEIPQNTGNIARTCAATGAALHLVRPLGFEIDDKKLKRAGLDYWHLLNITYHDSLEAFLEYARGKRLFFATTKAKKVYSDITYEDGDFLVFGKETRGLPETLIWDNPESSVRIPMIDEARSLNLSNSVAIMIYEALRQTGFSDLKEKGMLMDDPDHIPRELL
ncbi:MAG: tRNA (uridine(34)/cytosine(34)/5-carboxymethylaminomethyluridine(34)-2'-O)-methyltransferase TrmL [Clostridia bacterium]|nr:tRNA (uridine(34)/cytosine(34)/5-carboxymethylaminomethyluridine(34)-2'-O)-methyltransferase TrmL [Clostridia bacterium]